MSFSRSLRPWLIAGVFLAAAPAFAQWQWLESDGRKVYSDRPPPPSVPHNRILKQPGGAAVQASGTHYSNDETQAAARAARASAESAAAASAAASATAKVEADKKAATDKANDTKAQQAEAAEAAKRKAETDRIAAARAENCRRAKESKATLDSGLRIAKTNEKGERIVLDDKARAQEVQTVSRVISSDCGPMPKS